MKILQVELKGLHQAFLEALEHMVAALVDSVRSKLVSTVDCPEVSKHLRSKRSVNFTLKFSYLKSNRASRSHIL